MPSVRKIPFPPESRLQARVATATYLDAWEAGLSDASLTAVQIAERAQGTTPAWAEGLLRLRDRIVGPLGLKTVGRIKARHPAGAEGYQVGDRFSIFTIEAIEADELVLVIEDSHLDVRISYLRRTGANPPTYVVSALVQTHNLLGRIYMIPVGRFHPFLVATMMRRQPI
ncbi:DUF2867 domain-containing protein [Phenylobacterium aquaticum]|uniref:DUF2867 domain-containing protein n=1 Tax=Phenylobacterium aquaticum TaxID=1763816 RepID=UPI001F5D0094|nr:DUF2867 domain-containing protein [Phenylobacterium aquaticum]MCI3135272.1 DUF2867 domain-containing protein [Phenylobacterium aquaticum]